jgi:Fe-S cluster assembly iron-binding protein IscA
MPWIVCPHCTKREFLPLAICESWKIAARIRLPADELWFMNCVTCDSSRVTYAYMRCGVGTQVRLHEHSRTHFEVLNHEPFQEYGYCFIKESHDFCNGLHIYLATNEFGKLAVVLDPWVKSDNQTLMLTSEAVGKFQEFLNREPTNYKNYFRLWAKTGAKSQHTYRLELDHRPTVESDWVNDVHGFQIVIDADSWSYVRGCTIDWQVDANGTAGFKFSFSNATNE